MHWDCLHVQVGIENKEINLFPRLQRPYLAFQPQRPGAFDRCHFHYLVCCYNRGIRFMHLLEQRCYLQEFDHVVAVFTGRSVCAQTHRSMCPRPNALRISDSEKAAITPADRFAIVCGYQIIALSGGSTVDSFNPHGADVAVFLGKMHGTGMNQVPRLCRKGPGVLQPHKQSLNT